MDIPQVVEVKWVDSRGIGHWMEKSTLDEERSLECTTIGYLHEDAETMIVVVQSFDLDDGTVMHALQIPKVSISSMKVLRK